MIVAPILANSAPEDGLKILILVAAVIGLLWLGRWSSRLGTVSPPDSRYPEDIPSFVTSTPALKEEAVQLNPFPPNPFAPAGDEIAASFPYDPALGKIRMKKFFFEKIDALLGPPEPDVFADDLHVELYDPDSDSAWWQSYFVATPTGLSQILRKKAWKYLYATEILVLPRYDLEEIRRAVVSRIVADHEFFKPKPESEETL